MEVLPNKDQFESLNIIDKLPFVLPNEMMKGHAFQFLSFAMIGHYNQLIMHVFNLWSQENSRTVVYDHVDSLPLAETLSDAEESTCPPGNIWPKPMIVKFASEFKPVVILLCQRKSLAWSALAFVVWSRPS